jgi:hypothetical protein
MKVIQEFSGKAVDELCMRFDWGKKYSEKDYLLFIRSVDGLTYTDENLIAITYSIFLHTDGVYTNFKEIVANELINKAVVRTVKEM